MKVKNVTRCVLLVILSFLILGGIYSDESNEVTIFEFDAGVIVRLDAYEHKSYKYGEGIITFVNNQDRNIQTPIIVEIKGSRVYVNVVQYKYSTGFSIPKEGNWGKIYWDRSIIWRLNI